MRPSVLDMRRIDNICPEPYVAAYKKQVSRVIFITGVDNNDNLISGYLCSDWSLRFDAVNYSSNMTYNDIVTRHYSVAEKLASMIKEAFERNALKEIRL